MTIANNRLKSIVDRIEKVADDRDLLKKDIDDIYAEGKSNGYCVKTLRKIIALRKKDPKVREEEAALMETYLAALDMTA